MSKKQKLIALIAADMLEVYQDEMTCGVMKKARELGYDVAIFSSFIQGGQYPENEIGEASIYNLINYDKFDGVIYSPLTITMQQARTDIEKKLESCKCPVVIVGDIVIPHHCIVCDEYGAIKRMTEHFIEKHGFTRINCITGPKGARPSELRLQGYKDALTEAGIEIEEGRTYYGDFWHRGPEEYLPIILNSKLPLPQAIVCGNDSMAERFSELLIEKGYRVPEDICVSGYDKLEEGISHQPQITSANPQNQLLGEMAVSTLDELISGKEVEPLRTIPEKLDFSESCGCGKDVEGAKKAEQTSTQKLTQLSEYLETSFDSTERLLMANSIDECLTLLYTCHFTIDFLDEFYIVLSDDWETLHDSPDAVNTCRHCLSDRLSLRFARTDIHRPLPISFDSSEVFPILFEKSDKPKCYHFVPLNFKDTVFGYAVMGFGDEIKTYDFKFVTWIRSIANAIEQIRVRTHLGWALERLDKISIIDTLTGVYNRRGYERYAELIFSQSKKNKQKFLVIMGDLDCLKGINDNYGHNEGDVAIRAIAKAFQSCFTNNEVCARLGGDEFVVMGCGDYTNETIESYEKNIQSYLKRFNESGMRPYRVMTSVGVYCEIPSDETDINTCMELADERMYKDKKEHKQRSDYKISKSI